MKKLAAITLTSMMLLLATAMVVGAQVTSVEVRGAVAGIINGQSNLVDNSFTWDPQSFAGFYYDIKKDLGNENLKFVLSADNKLQGENAPYGITYATSTQNKAFERKLWGSYRVMGFQAERYLSLIHISEPTRPY